MRKYNDMLKQIKQVYEPPRILREVTVTGRTTILAGSVIDNTSAVTTSGQEVTDVKEGEVFEYSWDD